MQVSENISSIAQQISVVGADKSNSGAVKQPQSSWLSGAVKGFSEAFSSFTARFKTAGSSSFGQSKNTSAKGAGQKSMFSSLGNWGSSFSLKNFIGKISFSFGSKSNLHQTSRNSFLKPESDILAHASAYTGKHDAKAASAMLKNPDLWQTN